MTIPTFPDHLLYTTEGLWVSIDGDVATVGVTRELTDDCDIEFIDLPQLGEYTIGDEIGTVETLKASLDFAIPLSGTITEVNEDVENDPFTLFPEEDAGYEDGWIFRMTIADLAEVSTALLDVGAFTKTLNQH